MAVRAWQVHDTGLVAVLPRFRRLAGRRSTLGAPWPREVDLDVVDGALVVTAVGGAQVGRWPASSVTMVVIATGPPTSFTVDLGEAGAHLLATTPGAAFDALAAALPPARR